MNQNISGLNEHVLCYLLSTLTCSFSSSHYHLFSSSSSWLWFSRELMENEWSLICFDENQSNRLILFPNRKQESTCCNRNNWENEDKMMIDWKRDEEKRNREIFLKNVKDLECQVTGWWWKRGWVDKDKCINSKRCWWWWWWSREEDENNMMVE